MWTRHFWTSGEAMSELGGQVSVVAKSSERYGIARIDRGRFISRGVVPASEVHMRQRSALAGAAAEPTWRAASRAAMTTSITDVRAVSEGLG